jgi:hypothetical protein
MTFVADVINFREIVMKEPLPLTTIQNAVIDFVRGRDDAVLFGAQAVNVYVNEPRATQDVDLLSTRAAGLAEELRVCLSQRFHIAVQVRNVRDGLGYRVFQMREEGNRHLVDVRSISTLPPAQPVADVLVLVPDELIASKVIVAHRRRDKPKSGTDWRDLALLLLTFPELKSDPGPVTDCLHAAHADAAVLALWRELVAQEILPETEDDDF